MCFIMGSRVMVKHILKIRNVILWLKIKSGLNFMIKKFTLSKAYEKLDKLKKKFPDKEFKLNIIKK